MHTVSSRKVGEKEAYLTGRKIIKCRYWDVDPIYRTLGTRGFSRVRSEFSVLAEGRHIFGTFPFKLPLVCALAVVLWANRSPIKTWQQPETALEKSLAPVVFRSWTYDDHVIIVSLVCWKNRCFLQRIFAEFGDIRFRITNTDDHVIMVWLVWSIKDWVCTEQTNK